MATISYKRDIEMMTLIRSTQPSEPLLNKSLANNNNENTNYGHEVEIRFVF